MPVTGAKMPTSSWEGLPQGPRVAPSSFGRKSPSLLPIRCVTERRGDVLFQRTKIGAHPDVTSIECAQTDATAPTNLISSRTHIITFSNCVM